MLDDLKFWSFEAKESGFAVIFHKFHFIFYQTIGAPQKWIWSEKTLPKKSPR